jgi:U3 small nucleolar RNA-associated protein 18
VKVAQDAASSDEDGLNHISKPAAWVDSDDERIFVSLASTNRLRKLRVTEDEDVISGKEYIKRLRKQYGVWSYVICMPYLTRLRFMKLNPVPDWVVDAALHAPNGKRGRSDLEQDDSSDDNSDDNRGEVEYSTQPLGTLLRNTADLVKPSPHKTKKRKLRPEAINIQRMKNIANSGPSAITCLQVHPTLPFLVASGPSSRMDIYHMHSNPPDYSSIVTSLFVKKTPLTTTSFSPIASDPRIFLSARRRYFHVWNLDTGIVEKITRIYGHSSEQRSMEKFKVSSTGLHIAFLGSAQKGGGVLNILDMQTMQWIAQARIESHGGIADFEWWGDGKGICVAGKNGEVTEWSLEERRAVARWLDEGAVGTTVLALGGRSGRSELGGDRWVAIGSTSGIVNLYSRRQWLEDGAHADNAHVPPAPRPVRTLDQLTTPISVLVFAPDGQVLCMASRWKRDALRLVHLPSASVFRNWPTASTPLGRISAVAWSDVGGALKLVVANEAGRVMCWEVRE